MGKTEEKLEEADECVQRQYIFCTDTMKNKNNKSKEGKIGRRLETDRLEKENIQME